MNISHLAGQFKDNPDATLPESLMAENIEIAYELCHELDHLEECLENGILDDGIPSSVARRHLQRMVELADAFRAPLQEEY